MEYVFLAIFVIIAGLYLADRKGWNATAKRLTTIVRANIESGKPVKQIERKIEKKAQADWDEQFTGKPVASGKNHEIAKTWYARVGGDVYPHWRCKCGQSGWHINVEHANRTAQAHIRDQNKGDELLKLNGGTRAW